MTISRSDRIAGLLYGSLVADSLALGAHWIYDQDKLARDFGRVTELLAPRSDSYHQSKKRGQQTHYGDQTLALMDSISKRNGFEVEGFAQDWESMWDGYADYFDHATKETLQQRKAGLSTTLAASTSEELGGAARIGPLLAALASGPEDVAIAAARAQTAVTHNSKIAGDAAEFLTRIVFALLRGSELKDALEEAGSANYDELNFAEMKRRVKLTSGLSATDAAKELGLACPAPQALPTVLALLDHCGDNFETAVIENVMAGGDNAARALAVGLVLGAAHGKSGIPARWIEGLEAAPRVEAFLAGR